MLRVTVVKVKGEIEVELEFNRPLTRRKALNFLLNFSTDQLKPKPKRK